MFIYSQIPITTMESLTLENTESPKTTQNPSILAVNREFKCPFQYADQPVVEERDMMSAGLCQIYLQQYPVATHSSFISLCTYLHKVYDTGGCGVGFRSNMEKDGRMLDLQQ